MAYVQDIQFRRGEDVALTVAVTPAEDITGWSLELTIKKNFNSVAALLVKPAVILDATTGIFTVAIAAADTADLEARVYAYDVQRTNAGSKAVLTSGGLELLPST